ncbi:type II toxin-antitoxin system VapC family toxin [Qipengyuania qiaonensis]|uniref:Type II toxin-antitoxin system VapC family toxin n=1 Tax=Qipengyuania qiaonensis TaxID=2867240 RepID=A0ABS7JDU8_9SPHN|nr:type II toxin-antitoxin system VapC family toxin [Qipengyuania qiaonensis]
MTDAVFDTDILVDALCDVRPAQVELMRYSQRFISRMSWMEVMVAGQAHNSDRAEDFLDHFRVIELSEDVARQAAVLRAQRSQLSAVDAITLASAQSTGRILVTRNSKDFPAEMPGIRIPYTL